MIEPDDYGLTPLETLAHVASAEIASGHDAFWMQWETEAFARVPHLSVRTGHRLDASDPGATHGFDSCRNVSIGCRLLDPREYGWKSGRRPRAVVIATHGYDPVLPLEQVGESWATLAERGIAVLLVRVRGYPGSQADTGDLTTDSLGWITHGLNTEQDWILPLAVADVVGAIRAADQWFDGKVPLCLHGESFGAALAVLAVARLTRYRRGQEGQDEPRIRRLVVGLPSLGDWGWRLEHRCAGAGEQIAEFLRLIRTDAEEARQRLRWLDTVIHAHRVTCPVLCKLAQRDDTVPAPTAAAVYNALGTTADRKWRFLVPYGHFEGGLANARRHALFEKLRGAFLDPDVDAETLMAQWETVRVHGERAPAPDRSP